MNGKSDESTGNSSLLLNRFPKILSQGVSSFESLIFGDLWVGLSSQNSDTDLCRPARLFCFDKGRNGLKKRARSGSAEQQGN